LLGMLAAAIRPLCEYNNSMMLWLVFALMTAAAIFAVLWPLGRRDANTGGSDIAVYRDQLDEIGRDRAAGLIGEAEGEAAKVEVSRRLIAAADAAESSEASAPETSSLWRRRAAAIAGLLLLPIAALPLYLMLGSPQLPGLPLAARLQAPDAAPSIESMIARVEDHVERNPNDGRAWEVLAPVYMRVGRFDDAVRAWRNAINLNGSSASREADLGEALVAAGNGIVTAEAKAAFDRALALDGQDVMARFYIGMTADQDGRRAEAEAIWRDLLANAPPGAPWIEVVRHAMERNAPAGTAPASAAAGASGPSAADIAAAAKLPPDQQDQMVSGMVARLAERLKKDGSDVGGWARLVRSYRVLGQNDKAEAAIADARRALASDPEKLRQFAESTEAAAPAVAEISPAPSASAASPPGPNAADIAAAAQMNPDQQNQMIRGMVARLADKLKQDGSDIEGWQRLLRAYMVLGERDKAHAAAADARQALASDPDKLRRIEDIIREMGLQG
jgi:cytochrome c-type biogenesis protein CcmH